MLNDFHALYVLQFEYNTIIMMKSSKKTKNFSESINILKHKIACFFSYTFLFKLVLPLMLTGLLPVDLSEQIKPNGQEVSCQVKYSLFLQSCE